jgi:hypothetical protein
MLAFIVLLGSLLVVSDAFNGCVIARKTVNNRLSMNLFKGLFGNSNLNRASTIKKVTDTALVSKVRGTRSSTSNTNQLEKISNKQGRYVNCPIGYN